MKNVYPLVWLALLTVTVPVSAAQNVYRIMAVGDSITDGGKDAGYRGLLPKKLSAAGYRVQFVGTRGSEPLRHEAYGGKNAEFLAGVVGKSFQEHPVVCFYSSALISRASS